LLKADIEMHFLDQLDEDELRTLVDSIQERVDQLMKKN